MSKKLISVLLVVFMVAVALVGCSTPADTGADTKAPEEAPLDDAAADSTSDDATADNTSSDDAAANSESYEIVYAQIDLVNPFFVARLNGAKAKAEELGITLIEDDAQCDVSKQVSSIENYIAKGVDGIILIAVDAKGLEDSVKQATDAGIPVLGVIVKPEGCTAYANLDEYQFGYEAGVNAGEWIAEGNLPEDTECAILGYPLMEQNLQRIAGMRDGLLSKAPNAKIVSDDLNANNQELGMSCTETLLQAHPNLQVIICHSDAVALGAYEAVMANGDVDKENFFIGGIDATPDGVAKIKEGGIFRASVDMAPYMNAGKDVELMIDMIEGKDVEDMTIGFERVNWTNLDEWLANQK